ncbi:MAG: GNAT family N-acetyltransferase [Candidatus Methanomethylophilaceae archaeon]|nr:uncharacterized protein [Candidatus Methanomethylophilaceae archaeon]
MGTDIVHDATGCIFKVYVDGEEAGYLSYNLESGSFDIEHTVVDLPFRGCGLGKVLVEAAVQYATEKGVEIRPFCSYARVLLEKQGQSL